MFRVRPTGYETSIMGHYNGLEADELINLSVYYDKPDDLMGNLSIVSTDPLSFSLSFIYKSKNGLLNTAINTAMLNITTNSESKLCLLSSNSKQIFQLNLFGEYNLTALRNSVSKLVRGRANFEKIKSEEDANIFLFEQAKSITMKFVEIAHFVLKDSKHADFYLPRIIDIFDLEASRFNDYVEVEENKKITKNGI